MRAFLWGLLVALSVLAPVAYGWAQQDEDDREDALADASTFGTTPKELWKQVDTFFLEKRWLDVCARLDRLRAMGEDLKKQGKRAGYAYTQCARLHLKKNHLTEADMALDQAVQAGGPQPEQKPVEATLHRMLARMALEKKDLPQALAHFEIAASKQTDPKEEHDASLRLAKYAREALEADNTKAAKDAVAAALVYYPENRDALRLQDELEFWSSTGKYLVGAVVAALIVVVILALRRKSGGGGGGGPDPYDPYAT